MFKLTCKHIRVKFKKRHCFCTGSIYRKCFWRKFKTHRVYGQAKQDTNTIRIHSIKQRVLITTQAPYLLKELSHIKPRPTAKWIERQIWRWILGSIFEIEVGNFKKGKIGFQHSWFFLHKYKVWCKIRYKNNRNVKAISPPVFQ